MSTGRIDVDLEALEFFISTLRDFNNNLQTDWRTLNSRWQASSESWRDIKKDQFEGAVGWEEVIRMMEGYLSSADEYTNFLMRLHEAGSGYLGS